MTEGRRRNSRVAQETIYNVGAINAFLSSRNHQHAVMVRSQFHSLNGSGGFKLTPSHCSRLVTSCAKRSDFGRLRNIGDGIKWTTTQLCRFMVRDKIETTSILPSPFYIARLCVYDDTYSLASHVNVAPCPVTTGLKS